QRVRKGARRALRGPDAAAVEGSPRGYRNISRGQLLDEDRGADGASARAAVMKPPLFVAMVVALPAAAAEESKTHEVVPFAIAGSEGFGIASADGASRLITHWLLQSDLRAF